MISVDYSREGDVAYARLSRRRVAHTTELDDVRNLDYDKNGGVVGVEFLDVSDGVDLEDLPLPADVVTEIDEALAEKIPGIRVYA